MNTPPKTGWNASLRAGLLAAMTVLTGCGSLSQPLHDLTHPFGPSAHEESVRKQAEADSFPDAKHVGL